MTTKATAATAWQMAVKATPGNPRDEGAHADRAHLDEPDGGTADEDGHGEVLDDEGHEQDRWERGRYQYLRRCSELNHRGTKVAVSDKMKDNEAELRK